VRLLIAPTLLLIVTACRTAPDRDARAYNACALRHAQNPLVCEAPLQAYRVDASDFPARAAVPVPAPGADTNNGRL
jgi:hypothetical protein